MATSAERPGPHRREGQRQADASRLRQGTVKGCSRRARARGTRRDCEEGEGAVVPFPESSALKDMNVWVMNVVSVDSPDTLPIIYERGLFGMYHDWCESFSTYPRSYDLLHADHFFSKLKKRCKLLPVMVEVDRRCSSS
uniref:Methyltransferase n=1 Tax=Oryza rufipogon TaxID=4529 RepID=A0A0E0REJ5_ORYRU